MVQKGISLCGKCFFKYKAAGYRIKTVKKIPNQKVICTECKKRRYGGIYDLEEKKEDASA